MVNGKKTLMIAILFTVITIFSGHLAASSDQLQLTEEDYIRAQKAMSSGLNSLVINRVSGTVWRLDGTLWYNRSTADGHQFVKVDPRKKRKSAAFDHKKVAAVLSDLTEKKYTPENLPFKSIRFSDKGDAILFRVERKEYRYNLKTGLCAAVGNQKLVQGNPTDNWNSPDGKYMALIKDFNLWIRDYGTDKRTRLTGDGVEDFGYATNNAGWTKSTRPVLLWSPGADKIATFQQDARGVKEMYLASTNVGHPRLEAWKYPLPGDEHIFRLQRVIIHLNPLRVVRLKMAPDPQRSSITDHVAGRGGRLLDAQWNRDGTKLAFVSTSRNHQVVTLRIADADTGDVRDVLTEQTETFFESGYREPNWRIFFETNEFIWFSQRDNWGHLYLYDLTSGKLKNRITTGKGNAKHILKIDKKRRLIYFTGNCREAGNPYFDYLYRVQMNGRGFTCLTPERGHHSITLSPSGNYFVDTYSTIEQPPVVVLRNLRGKSLLTLEKTDISKLVEKGWKAPQLICEKGRDGKTDLYGLMYTPSNFDPAKSYPIVNYIYPGPQSGSVGSFSFRVTSGNQGLAELGFVVVSINGMGTPNRSKSFHDTYYANMGDNTLPDQIIVMKQLAEKYSWIDINRVGIHGHSGGGFASADAILRYPDFFKVAVSQSGNHDNRNYEAPWGEKWQGLLQKNEDKSDNYHNQANQLLAKNLKGKLLIAHGMLDSNVPPYSTLLVVQELIKANKDFDLLLFPNSRHGYRYRDYMTRRRWDYFVSHLLGAIPPKEYDFSKHK